MHHFTIAAAHKLSFSRLIFYLTAKRPSFRSKIHKNGRQMRTKVPCFFRPVGGRPTMVICLWRSETTIYEFTRQLVTCCTKIQATLVKLFEICIFMIQRGAFFFCFFQSWLRIKLSSNVFPTAASGQSRYDSGPVFVLLQYQSWTVDTLLKANLKVPTTPLCEPEKTQMK